MTAQVCLAALRSTDGDVLQVSEWVSHPSTAKPKWDRCGDITLIYGNCPWEVIADHSDNVVNSIIAGAKSHGRVHPKGIRLDEEARTSV